MLAPLGIIIVILILFCAVKCCKKCIEKSQKGRDIFIKIKNIIFFSGILRVILTGFVPVVVSSGIGKNYGTWIEHKDTNWPQVIYVGAVTGLTCFFVVFIDSKNFEAANFKKKWQTLYAGVRTDN